MPIESLQCETLYKNLLRLCMDKKNCSNCVAAFVRSICAFEFGTSHAQPVKIDIYGMSALLAPPRYNTTQATSNSFTQIL